MSAPAPFVIRRDGTLLDRETETIVGKVWLDPEHGWCSDGPHKRHSGAIGRKYAAKWAWDEWNNLRRKAAQDQKKEN